jgi:hypothetical protein
MAFKLQSFQCTNSKKEMVSVDKLTEAEAKQELCRLMRLLDKIDYQAWRQQQLVDDWRHGR